MALQNPLGNPPTYSAGHQCYMFLRISSLVDSSPRENEPMELWDFSMTSLMSKLISVFVGCQVLRSRLQKFGLRMSSYMWQKHRGTSIGGDIREVTRPRFHDHHLCTSFFFSFFVGGGVKANLIEKNQRECPLQNKKIPQKWTVRPTSPPPKS